MTLRSLAGLVLSSFAAVALGCGGGSSNPPLTPDVAHDGGGEPFGEVNPADLAELDGGAGAKAPSTPSAGGDTASAAPAAPSTPEPKDECTPVGVDFEKRARPKMKECYATAKKKEPNLQGSVKISVDIDTLGKVKTIKILEKTLPEAVAQCMLKAVKATPLPEAAKCPGKSLTIPVTFPTPH
jgi:hypothetical protein